MRCKSGKEDDWQLKCSGKFVWFNSMFATYRTTIFTYFGGIHPDVWHGNVTYDRRTGRRITLADMFDETNIVSVVNVIRRKIAADESCSEYLREQCSNDVTGVAADYLGECHFGDPKVTENFMIVECGDERFVFGPIKAAPLWRFKALAEMIKGLVPLRSAAMFAF